MSFFLALPKKTVLELSKSLPAVGMAEDIDFETWGRKFVDAIVSESIFVESIFLMNVLSGNITILLPSLGNQPRIERLSQPSMKHIIFNSFDKREWVGWASKTLMLKLYGEIEAEKLAAATVEKC
jgi:hypothetical protein